MNTNKIMDSIRKTTPTETNKQVDFCVTIANRIFDVMAEQGMKQRDLAKALGKTETEVSRWLSGTHNLTIATIAKIAAVLGDDIITTTTSVHPYKLPEEVQVTMAAEEIHTEQKKYKTFYMSKNITNTESKVLKALANGNSAKITPKGLTDAQYYAAVKSLNAKKLVFAQFGEGGDVVDAKIKIEGQAALDDFIHLEKSCLRKVLRSKEISLDQYDLLVYAQKNKECKNIFGINDYTYKSSIETPLFNKRYIGPSFYSYDHSLRLTERGQELLIEIDDLVEEEITNRNNDSHEEIDFPLPGDTSFTTKQDNTYHSNIYIAKEHITDFIKVLFSQCELGYFKDSDNKDLPKKKIMDELANIFNAPQLTKYSSYLNNACSSSTKNTYLDPFYQLEDNAEQFKMGQKKRKINQK